MANALVRLLPVVAAASVFLASAAAASFMQPDTRPGAPGGGVSVESAMKTMNRSLRQLRGMVGDAGKKDDALRVIGEMQRACLTAKSQSVPADVLKNARDDAARAHMPEEFRHELITLMRALLDLEEDIAAGRTDAAKSRIADIVKIRDHAHGEMGIQEEQTENGAGGGAQPRNDAAPAGGQSTGQR
jgi:soluble cytochrome b562